MIASGVFVVKYFLREKQDGVKHLLIEPISSLELQKAIVFPFSSRMSRSNERKNCEVFVNVGKNAIHDLAYKRMQCYTSICRGLCISIRLDTLWQICQRYHRNLLKKEWYFA